MKKVKLFFVAAALLLVTAGVFAGKAKFAVSGLYILSGVTTGTYVEIAASTTGEITNAGTTQAVLINSETSPLVQYPLYTWNGSTHVAAFTTF
jgi:hypothetical protein